MDQEKILFPTWKWELLLLEQRITQEQGEHLDEEQYWRHKCGAPVAGMFTHGPNLEAQAWHLLLDPTTTWPLLPDQFPSLSANYLHP